MGSKVTEYALMLFFSFVSMLVLYFLYLGLMNSQNFVKNQVNNEEYKKECNCFQLSSISDSELILRDINCNYINNLTVVWPDYEFFYNDTIKKNDLIIIEHNSTNQDFYTLYYNNCE